MQFELSNGRVIHEGLVFGLPDLAPDLQIRSHGSVGLDESLDMLVEIDLPLERLGSGPLAKVLGQQTLKIPIVGTLSEPRVEFRADGQFIRDVMSGVVDELANPETADDVVEQLKALRGNLQERLENFRNNGSLRGPAPLSPPEERPRFWRLRRWLEPADEPADPPAKSASPGPEQSES